MAASATRNSGTASPIGPQDERAQGAQDRRGDAVAALRAVVSLCAVTALCVVAETCAVEQPPAQRRQRDVAPQPLHDEGTQERHEQRLLLRRRIVAVEAGGGREHVGGAAHHVPPGGEERVVDPDTGQPRRVDRIQRLLAHLVHQAARQPRRTRRQRGLGRRDQPAVADRPRPGQP